MSCEKRLKKTSKKWEDGEHINMEVSRNGVPQHGWFIMENPTKMNDLAILPEFAIAPLVLLKLTNIGSNPKFCAMSRAASACECSYDGPLKWDISRHESPPDHIHTREPLFCPVE